MVEHEDKDQATKLEIAESFILCGHQTYKTHNKSIAIFLHNDDLVEEARGRITDKGSNIDMTPRIRLVFSAGEVIHDHEGEDEASQKCYMCEQKRDCSYETGACSRSRQSLQPRSHIGKRTPGHQGWRGSLCHNVEHTASLFEGKNTRV